MAVTTHNGLGKISIEDQAIAKVVKSVALDCYGIVDTVSKGIKDSLMEVLRKQPDGKGVKVVTSGDRIFITVNVIMKYGVSIMAVAESLKSSIKYSVERFTGMIVDTVNVNIVGVRV